MKRSSCSVLEHDTVTPDLETSSDAYSERFGGDVGRFLLRAQADAVECLLREPAPHPLKVLDVGGGHGQLAPLLLDWGCEVWVHGSAPPCLRRVRHLPGAFEGRARLVTSSLWSLPFAERSFDLVCAVRVMSHVEAWQALLAEMARITRRWLLIDYASLAGFNLFTPVLFRLKRRVEGDTRPYFSYRTGRLAREMRILGFDEIRVRKQLFVPMAVHRMVGNGSLSEGAERIARRIGLTALLGSPAILLAERVRVRDRARSRGAAGEGGIR